MTFNDIELLRRPHPTGRLAHAFVARRRALLVSIGLAAATAVLAAGCTSSHKNAAGPTTPPASASGSGLSSGPVAPLSSGPASQSPIGVVSPSSVASLPTPVSSAVAPGPPVANVEAPAPKGGFQVRLHRGLLLKVDMPQAKAGAKLAFALNPTASASLKPLAGYDGYYIGNADGVVTVQVSQDGVAAGTLTVTVWG